MGRPPTAERLNFGPIKRSAGFGRLLEPAASSRPFATSGSTEPFVKVPPTTHGGRTAAFGSMVGLSTDDGGSDQPFTKWKDTAMERTASRYPEPTASTQADTEATQLGASVSFIRAVTGRPACSSATARRLDWVPDREWADVPEEIAAICSSCPLQKACLRWATDHDEPGYWGGTTRAQRAAGITLESLEQVRAQRRVEEAAKCLHSEAEGPSMEWYRRGCPCRGCKAANAARAARYKRARQARHQLSVAS
jgi:hypothetical protein